MNGRRSLLLTLGLGATICLSAARCDLLRLGGRLETGTLKVLVTDKPFPIDLIEKALITITRVEVRRSGGGPQCATDADCDDAQFCNGSERCVAGDCQDGDAPCLAEEICDDENDACFGPCTTSDECDDGLFCNGVEECLDARCTAGNDPCLEDEACDEENDDCLPPGTGNGNGDDADNDDDDNGGGGSPFVTIFEGERTIDLLELQDGRTHLLTSAEIPAGTYTQMRLIVTGGQVTLKDNAGVFPLTVPSGSQTGIKLNFTFDVDPGEQTTLLLDVDVSKLFVPVPGGMIEDPGTIREFLFRPAVAMRLIDVVDAGSISGVVTDESGNPMPNAVVTAFHNGEDVTSTFTGPDGTFVLSGLPAGNYSVEVSLVGFADAGVPVVAVTAGAATEVNVVLTAAP